MPPSSRPRASGLYDPAYEHDACGVALVARLDGQPEHEVVSRALTVVENLEHRGAAGADPTTGDGAGILMQIPDALLRERVPFALPEPGAYAVGMLFLPRNRTRRTELRRRIAEIVEAEGQRILGWRRVPVDETRIGTTARVSAPVVEQLFVAAADELVGDELAFERRLYVIRRLVEKATDGEVAIPSFSSRTLVYKGMLISRQLTSFYLDLQDDRCTSALALVHSRFSTNTFPSWELAHPYRFIAHNGEINTLRGNVNWMRARESQLRSELFGDEDLQKLLPVVTPGNSDSATFDNVLELLVLSGRSLPHAMMMMIPEAYGQRSDMPDELKGFYAFHSCLMEPWDGPAAVAFTDGRTIGATLDRNGLRPGRWVQTRDGYVILASEAGALPIDEALIERKGRLQPGNIFLIDLEQGRIVADAEVKHGVAALKPYGSWFEENSVHLADLPERAPRVPRVEPLRSRQLAFGWSQEDLRVLLAPMAAKGEEPTGSMGNDVALAVLSDRQPALFAYFKQLFAQVTNPPIDPIRESIVMSLATAVGGETNVLTESPAHAHTVVLDQPILRNGELEKLRQVDHALFEAQTVDVCWPREDAAAGLPAALARICAEADAHVAAGANILILSDRNLGAERVPVPSLLAVAAVHQHLVRAGTRLRVGLVVESGEPREVHHFATLLGYGASAINPYLMFEGLQDLHEGGLIAGEQAEAEAKVVKAIGKGLLKVLSKMGISTIQSYCGAQIFEAVGLAPELVDAHFTGTASRIGGVGVDVLAEEALARHARGYAAHSAPRAEEELLPVGGLYAWRRGGEHHQWNPSTIALLQRSARSQGTAVGANGHDGGLGSEDSPSWRSYEEYARVTNEEATKRATLRGLLGFRPKDPPIPLSEVEPAADIVRRFATGAMSLGSISPESHEALAIAMNRIGGKSNTGEGGEDARRYLAEPDGDSRRSAIKQVASGRFGVTVHYLVNADEIQIKMAQGAKPGEGGQLPGHKVDRYIGKLRHSTPGVALISPPPHHDIYSIEDLKQLIYDLRCANPYARISVKLVAEVGVGTVAAGVAKANADHIVIAGHDGGTGASPQSSIQSAGVPWEIGLAETQQTLLRNDLRSRVAVQTDGQMKTGRDVVIAALLGADEFGFSTAPLIALGCIMMRVCHLNTCPVGIATQDPRLREKFDGKPEHVIQYLINVAEEARRIMASLGVARFEDLVGRTDLLAAEGAIDHWKARGVDLSALLVMPQLAAGVARRKRRPQDPVLGSHLDHALIEQAQPALRRGERVALRSAVHNVDRTVGGLLSGEIARSRHGAAGLPEGSITVDFEGSAGQSFGAWLSPGVSFTLRGEANDYTGKGLSGGIVAVRPADGAGFVAEENVIVGNTVLYGATSGRAFFRGLAGERFGVRNSGASAVVEGIGDHGCEYMTGGRVVVLGPTGRNFAAGMSGGVAYVLDVDGGFRERCNLELVGLDDPLDEADAIELHDLIAEHGQRTGSPVAARILADWALHLPRFVKVVPHDYKRAMAELSRAEDTAVGRGPVAQEAVGGAQGPGTPPSTTAGDGAAAHTPGEGRVPGDASGST